MERLFVNINFCLGGFDGTAAGLQKVSAAIHPLRAKREWGQEAAGEFSAPVLAIGAGHRLNDLGYVAAI